MGATEASRQGSHPCDETSILGSIIMGRIRIKDRLGQGSGSYDEQATLGLCCTEQYPAASHPSVIVSCRERSGRSILPC